MATEPGHPRRDLGAAILGTLTMAVLLFAAVRAPFETFSRVDALACVTVPAMLATFWVCWFLSGPFGAGCRAIVRRAGVVLLATLALSVPAYTWIRAVTVEMCLETCFCCWEWHRAGKPPDWRGE